MRKRYILAAIICFTLATLCAVNLFGQEPPKLFKTLQYSHAGMTSVDFGLTLYVMSYYGNQAKELNPVAALYVRQPVAHAALVGIGTAVIQWGTTELYKKNKTMAWVAVITLNVTHALILVNNLKQLSK